MLETHFGPLSALVCGRVSNSMDLTVVAALRAAPRAAPYGDASGADFRPSDVDYEGPPSLIQMIEESTLTGQAH